MPPLVRPEAHAVFLDCLVALDAQVRRGMDDRDFGEEWVLGGSAEGTLASVLGCETLETVGDALSPKVAGIALRDQLSVRAFHDSPCGRVAALYGQHVQLVQEVGDRLAHILLSFELQGTRERDTNEDLEVVREPSDQGKQLLGHAHSPGACLLGMR